MPMCGIAKKVLARTLNLIGIMSNEDGGQQKHVTHPTIYNQNKFYALTTKIAQSA